MGVDVIIAGGGMVGLSLACALGSKGLRVAVVEAREPVPFERGADFDTRVSAISPASEAMLRSLGAWDYVVQQRCCPYHRMIVWDALGRGRIEFDAAGVGEDHLGHIIENRVVQWALLQRLNDHADARWHGPDQVIGFDVLSDRVTVGLKSGVELTGKVLVGADGPASQVRQLAGIRFDLRDYDQEAVVATVGTEASIEATAWQRFLPTGPLAFLPLQERRASIVWSTNSQDAGRLMSVSKDEFCGILGEAIEHRFGRVTEVSERARFPLRGGAAEPFVQPRLALVGDAAHVIHPLAGQGVNLGFKDTAVLSHVLTGARRDLGSLRVLRQYERARKLDVLLTLRAMEGFRYLFAGDFAPLAWIRGAGLSAADAATPVKHAFMRYAMGMTREYSRLGS